MKTIEINLYSYEELSQEVQKTVLNKYCDLNIDNSWYDYTYEDAAQIGLKITGFDIDYRPNASGDFTLSANEVAQSILSEHGNMCETYEVAEIFMNKWQPIFNDYMNENSKNYESVELSERLIDLESGFLNTLLHLYAKLLRHEYEYLTSDAAIIDTFEANNYTFEASGKMNNS